MLDITGRCWIRIASPLNPIFPRRPPDPPTPLDPSCTSAYAPRQVPYNPLLDRGYKSIGDVHSTALPDPSAADGAGERSGRWQGKNKTECGLHSNYWEMKKRFEAKAAGTGTGMGGVEVEEVAVRNEAEEAEVARV